MTTLAKEEKKTMEKLDPKKNGASPDVVAENLERMRELFPEVFAEGKVDFEALRETLGEYVEDKQERYSFTWHGKGRARLVSQSPSLGTLLPCPDDSKNWASTKNIFIEGDNLEVLKLLQKAYHRRVKMIYIDPPYNTGNEFIYPDKYQDHLSTYLRYTGQIDDQGLKLATNTETSGRYHTNWLNMMYPRLRLARNLLRDDGVMFVSIDDHEAHNLRMLLDEVFGPENFVSAIVWQKRDTTAADSKSLSVSHEYVLVYQRSDAFERRLLPRTDAQIANYKNPDNDPRGPWTRTSLIRKQVRENRLFPITNPSGREIVPPAGTSWRPPPEKFAELEKDNRLWWGARGDGDLPFKKTFLTEVQQGVVPVTWWDYKFAGSNRTSKVELRDLFGGKVPFDTPKPVLLMERMLQIATDGDDLVMDFFAGSCPVAHAAIKLNAEQGTSRRFLMVQLPEPVPPGSDAAALGCKTIADVGRLRIRTAGDAIVSPTDTGELPGISPASAADSGFRSFKLATSNIKSWDADFDALNEALLNAVENIKRDRSEDDVLYELLLKYGLDLAIPIESRAVNGKTVYIIGAGALVVCLATGVTLEVVEGIAALKDELKPEVMRVVFRDAGFADDVVKTNTVQTLKQAGIDDVKSL